MPIAIVKVQALLVGYLSHSLTVPAQCNCSSPKIRNLQCSLACALPHPAPNWSMAGQFIQARNLELESQMTIRWTKAMLDGNNCFLSICILYRWRAELKGTKRSKNVCYLADRGWAKSQVTSWDIEGGASLAGFLVKPPGGLTYFLSCPDMLVSLQPEFLYCLPLLKVTGLRFCFL